jgi:hypothetical protein
LRSIFQWLADTLISSFWIKEGSLLFSLMPVAKAGATSVCWALPRKQVITNKKRMIHFIKQEFFLVSTGNGYPLSGMLAYFIRWSGRQAFQKLEDGP